MSLLDWLGVAIMAPFLVAMVLLIIYLTIGLIGSGPRRRRIAQQAQQEKKRDEKASNVPQQMPGD